MCFNVRWEWQIPSLSCIFPQMQPGTRLKMANLPDCECLCEKKVKKINKNIWGCLLCVNTFNMHINNKSRLQGPWSEMVKIWICTAGVEGLWLVSAGFPSVSRNRDAYQSIDHQEDSSTSGNPFNQTPDSKPGARTYWATQPSDRCGVFLSGSSAAADCCNPFCAVPVLFR